MVSLVVTGLGLGITLTVCFASKRHLLATSLFTTCRNCFVLPNQRIDLLLVFTMRRAAHLFVPLVASCCVFTSGFNTAPSLLLRTTKSSSRQSSLASTGTEIDGTAISKKIAFELHPSITDISAESWDQCLADDGSSSPFLEHAWLRCLEESRCASPETGWVPQHLSILMDGEKIGYVPLYIKGHSMGEFIFDNAWAEAAYQSGISYYPKLLVGIPFTPATGQRILLRSDVWGQFSSKEIAQLRRSVATFLRQVAESNNISGVHFNFLTAQEATDLSGELPEPCRDDDEEGSGKNRLQSQVQKMFSRLSNGSKNDFMRRTSLQYHWQNRNAKNDGKQYETFDDYLGCFKSKRRITIRRERRRVLEDEGIRIDAVVGDDILKYDGLVERMFEIYLSTVDKMIWGRQYLTKEFFQMLADSDFRKNLCFMCARLESSGEELNAEDVFAGTFNIVKNGVFFGRYWGCLPGKEVKNLHFETCYWAAIDFCIKNKMKRMEPGAGGGGT